MAKVFPASQLGLAPAVEDGAQLQELHAEVLFFEGAAWDPLNERLLFTVITEGRKGILALDDGASSARVWLDYPPGVNGTHLSNDGRRLLAAGRASKAVVALDLTRKRPEPELIAVNDDWCEPNDLVQAPDGSIYLSDVDPRNTREDPGRSGVYLIRPDGSITKVLGDMAFPNGVQITQDGRNLVVSDSTRKDWRIYPIREDGTLGPGRMFFDPATEDQSPGDGITLDEHGDLYLTGRGGVWQVSPQGEARGFIPVPVFCSNIAFGGADGKTLYLTGDGRVYSLQMKVRGGTVAPPDC